MSVKRNAKLRAAFLKAASDGGDVETVRELIIHALRNSGDPELCEIADIFDPNAKTGVTAKFAKRRGRTVTGSRPVACRNGEMKSRREIASAVYDCLGRPRLNEKIERTRIKVCIGEVAALLDISDKTVSDCFNQYRGPLEFKAHSRRYVSDD